MSARPDPDRDRPVVLRCEDTDTQVRPVTAARRLFLLHGMANTPTVWRPLVEGMRAHPGLWSDSVWTAALPWRNGGAARWSHRTGPATWVAAALDGMVAAAGPADVVVAHSYAATALLDLLATEAERGADPATRWGLRRLVLLAPFYRARPEDFDWDTVSRLGDDFVDTMEEGIRVGAGHRGDPSLQRAMATRVCEMIGPYGWARFVELYLRTPFLRIDLIRMPTVVVSGTGDRIAAPAESEALALRLPAGVLRPLADCGHFPMAECPTVLADLIAGAAAQPDEPPAPPCPAVPTGRREPSDVVECDR